MGLRLKHLLVGLVGLLCVAFAYAPLFRSGLLVRDHGALAAALEESPSTEPHLRPLARLSLRTSLLLFGLVPIEPTLPDASPDRVDTGSLAAARALRLENLVLLALGALGLAAFLRRLLLPWIGHDSARAAGQAAALLLLLHPLSLASVADVAGRGDLLAVALSLCAAACFLRGRQDRLPTSALLALLFAIAAGLAADVALGLGPLLCLAELCSSRRYRPLRARLRTGSTTLTIFGAATLLEPAWRALRGAQDPWPPGLRALAESLGGGALWRAIETAVEKLGWLVLPANAPVLGLAGVVAAGALFLLAVQPALWAARSAPRLWGWFLTTWILALLASQLLHARVVPGPDEFWSARAFLPSVVVLVAGLGLASTALSSPRRLYVTWVVAIGLAAVAHGNARPWPAAAERTASLRRDLVAVQRELGTLPVWVLDPPSMPVGMEPLARDPGALRALLAPSLVKGGSASAGEAPPEVRTLAARAFLALVGEPELDGRVAEGLALLLPARLLDEEHGGEGRVHRALVPQAPSSGPRSWSGTLSSPTLDLATWNDSALRVTVPGDVDPAELARVSWLARGGAAPGRGTVPGVWSEAGEAGEERLGIFDLGGSLGWRLGGRVRRLLFAEGTRQIRRAEIHSALPELGAGAPRVTPEGWRFPLDGPRDPGAVYALELVDTRDLAWSEHRPESDPSDPAVLRFPDTPSVSIPDPASDTLGGSAPWVWILEARVEGHAVARSRGRL